MFLEFNHLTVLYAVIIGQWISNTIATDVIGNTTYDYELFLRKDLLQNYNVHVLPKQRSNEPIRVDVLLTLASIRELNERKEQLTIEAYMLLVWNDSRLTWTSSDYGGIKTVQFPENQIWQPDIKLFNSARAGDVDTWGNVYTSVKDNGNVRWIPPATFHSICSVDLQLYPYDVQTCKLHLVSWTLDGHHVDISLYENNSKIGLSDPYNENNEWEVIDSKAAKEIRYLSCCTEPYPQLVYELQLRRRAPYYKLTTLYPIMSVVVLSLATFWLPPTSERILLGAANLLVTVAVLVHLSWKLPPSGRSIPMIIAFSGNCVLIITTSIITSIISISMAHSNHHRGSPKWMKVIFNSWFGRLLCVAHPKTNKNGEPTVEFDLDDCRMSSYDCRMSSYESYRGDHHHFYYNSKEWKQCLKVFDRICFIIFIGIFSFALGSSFKH
ncbi:hypothetical protein CHUAL_000638 [Chamberlinius hualienensis]